MPFVIIIKLPVEIVKIKPCKILFCQNCKIKYVKLSIDDKVSQSKGPVISTRRAKSVKEELPLDFLKYFKSNLILSIGPSSWIKPTTHCSTGQCKP